MATYTELAAAQRLERLTAAREKAEKAAARLDQAAENARQALIAHEEGTPELAGALTRASREVRVARRDIADAAVELRSWMAVARRRDDRAAIAEGEKLEGIIAGLAIVEAQIDALIDT